MKSKLFIFFLLLIAINCNFNTSQKMDELINPFLIFIITLIIVILSILFRYLNTSPLYNQKDTFPLNIKYLFQDKQISFKTEVPILDSLFLNISSSLIYGQILSPPISNNNEKHPVLIFFHGFPGFTTFDDVAYSLCRSGCIVIIPKHRGAWGSQGLYSISNCIEDAENLTKYVFSEEFKKYNPDLKNVFLMGHSMGGNTVVNVSKKVTNIKGIILVAPCDMITLSDKVDDNDLVKFFEENGVNVLKVESMQSLVKETREKKNFKKFKESVRKDLNVFAAVAEYDSVTPGELCVDPMMEELIKNKKNNILFKKQYSTEHSFMGVRTILSRDIAEFINKCYTI